MKHSEPTAATTVHVPSIAILNCFVVINYVAHVLCKNLLDLILKLYFIFMQLPYTC